MLDKSEINTLEDLIAPTNSVRGALFALKNNIEAFGNCHLAYEFVLYNNAYKRGDLVNITTLPADIYHLYLPSGGTNSDPVIENIGVSEEPIFVDLKQLCAMKQSRFYKNPFYLSLINLGYESLAAYPILLGETAGSAVFTIIETRAQHESAREDAYYTDIGIRFHNHIRKHGLLANYFNITDKEKYALQKMAAGKTTLDIAQDLGLMQRSIEARLQKVRKKLKASTTTEAVFKAAVYGILPT